MWRGGYAFVDELCCLQAGVAPETEDSSCPCANLKAASVRSPSSRAQYIGLEEAASIHQVDVARAASIHSGWRALPAPRVVHWLIGSVRSRLMGSALSRWRIG